MLSNKKSILNLVFAGLFLFSFTSVFADDHNHSEDTDTHAVDNHDHEDLGHEAAADFGHEPDTGAFDAVGMIMAHIQDANEWHIATIGDAHTGTHISIPLPVIIYDGSLKVFLSNKVAHGHEHAGYAMDHHGQVYSATGLEKATVMNLGSDNLYYDISITKNVAGMLVACILLIWMFTSMVRIYKNNNGVPKGIAKFLEPVVLFVRDDIAIPNIGKEKYMKFLPYLLTLFFFIWINNMLGLVPFFPGGTNVTGNIAITLVLSVITVILVNVNGTKGYWMHILWPPVPLLLKPLMIPIEIIGIFTKPFALMMRLFANITAGHIMMLSLVALIFIFKTALAGFISVPLAIFISLLEILVAALQAYIFTVLTALFIGMAVQEHH